MLIPAADKIILCVKLHFYVIWLWITQSHHYYGDKDTMGEMTEIHLSGSRIALSICGSEGWTISGIRRYHLIVVGLLIIVAAKSKSKTKSKKKSTPIDICTCIFSFLKVFYCPSYAILKPCMSIFFIWSNASMTLSDLFASSSCNICVEIPDVYWYGNFGSVSIQLSGVYRNTHKKRTIIFLRWVFKINLR